MSKFKYYTPDGVQDILPGECYIKKETESKIRDLFRLNGFREIETPTLEFYDVFSAGEGFAPQEGMFKFFDNTGRILVLRYDGTVPAARLASTILKDEPAPLKLFYIGNMFRYNETGGGKQREFTQAGVEILGPNTPEADAQAVELAVMSALEAGITDLQVSVGNVEFFKGLTEEWSLDLQQQEELQKIIDGKETLAIKDFCIRQGLPENAKSILSKMLYSCGTEDVIYEMRSMVKNSRSLKALDNLEQVRRILDDCEMSRYISLDLGMLQSLNYYTGIIFKGFTYGIGFPVFSGGRYDNVVARFGREMSATGFSLGINLVINALRRQGKLGEDKRERVLVAYAPQARKAAFAYAADLRKKGSIVITDCTGSKKEDIINRNGSTEVIYFDTKGKKERLD
jgi:ATP phosphoribosyltransferase regulatory subunit